jgi:chromosome segregation ATPase
MNERLDRVERILDHMAARQQYHDEALERMDGAIVRMSASIEKLANRQSDFESVMEELASGQRQLITAQVIMSDKISELTSKTSILDEKMAQLADAQKHTDERLSALINIVMKSQQPPTM